MRSSLNSRHGLTLLELIVVLVILAALAGLVIPRLTGVTELTGSAASAGILQGISEAESRYEAQHTGKIPTGWDGIVDSSGALYSRLHPNLLKALDSTGTILGPVQLSAMQAQSLKDAGMAGIHLQDPNWTGVPSESGRIWQTTATGATMAFLQLPTGSVSASNFTVGHNVMFSDRAFSITPFSQQWGNAFVVVGFGNESDLKRNSVQETPLFASVSPGQYYARGLLVFMVPAAGVTMASDSGYFKAQYVGCFAPDGTCLMDNLGNFAKTQQSSQ